MEKIDRKFINWIFESSILVVLVSLFGNWLDRRLDTHGTFLGLFMLGSTVFSGYYFSRLYRQSMRSAEKEDAEHRKDEE